MSTAGTIRRERRRQRGLASVEMAVVTPALLFMMLASAEFTRVFYDYNTLTKSVRDAARLATLKAVDGGGGTDIGGPDYTEDDIKNLAVTGRTAGGTPLLRGLTTNDITVRVIDLGGVVERPYIEVSATYAFRPFAPVLDGMGFTDNVDMDFRLTASSTMRTQK